MALRGCLPRHFRGAVSSCRRALSGQCISRTVKRPRVVQMIDSGRLCVDHFSLFGTLGANLYTRRIRRINGKEVSPCPARAAGPGNDPSKVNRPRQGRLFHRRRELRQVNALHRNLVFLKGRCTAQNGRKDDNRS